MLFALIYLFYAFLLLSKKAVARPLGYLLTFFSLILVANIALAPSSLNAIYFMGALFTLLASLTLVVWPKEGFIILYLKKNNRFISILLFVMAIASALATYLL